MQIFGFRLIHHAELEKIHAEHASARTFYGRHTEMLENELAYYRNRADDERARADRLNDALLQQNGLPETTSTVIRERQEARDHAVTEHSRREDQVMEMFAEQVNTNFDQDGFELPGELADAARSMIAEVKEQAKK